MAPKNSKKRNQSERSKQTSSPMGTKHPHDESEPPKSAKKRKAEEANRETQLQLVAEIPVILKKQLLDEYDLIIGSNKTVPLPRKPNAMHILRQFYDYGRKELRCTNTELQMLITGLEEYMDKTLEDFLLYEIEWKTAKQLLNGGVSASSVYGAEHLLRLLVKLPDLIPQTSTTVQQSNALQARVRELLDFLVMNRHAFFANTKEYTF